MKDRRVRFCHYSLCRVSSRRNCRDACGDALVYGLGIEGDTSWPSGDFTFGSGGHNEVVVLAR